jgi:hypothetical protein
MNIPKLYKYNKKNIFKMEENLNSDVKETEVSENLHIHIEGEENNVEEKDMPEFDYDNLTDDEKERIDEINDLIKAEKIDPTTAMNILINAVQVSYDKEHFNDLDRYLIAKSLTTFKDLSDKGEDIVIKTT